MKTFKAAKLVILIIAAVLFSAANLRALLSATDKQIGYYQQLLRRNPP